MNTVHKWKLQISLRDVVFVGWSDRIEREREWLGMWHAWKR